MKRKTFDELVNSPILTNDTLVKCCIADKYFDGRVVGLSGTGIIQYYIIECMDDTLPNDIYPYKFVSLPISEIETL